MSYMKGIKINWSTDEYSLKDFYSKFKSSLPQIIKVSQGYYADVETESFDVEDVFFLRDIFNQKRILARSDRFKCVSIPLNSPLKFKVEGQAGESLIKDIIKKYVLPMQVRLSGRGNMKFRIGNSEYMMSQFGVLNLLREYKSTYFIGHVVYEGKLENMISEIPFQVPIMVYRGMRSNEITDNAWGSFLRCLESDAGLTNIKVAEGYKDIAVYNIADEAKCAKENIYDVIDPENIQPETYARIINVTSQAEPEGRRYISFPVSSSSDVGFSDLDSTKNPPPLPPRRKSSSTSEPDWNSSIETKDRVMSMSVHDLGRYLVRLKLEKFVDRFKEEMIDGIILSSLNEAILVKDFKMSTIQARRLFMFAKYGHIPQ